MLGRVLAFAGRVPPREVQLWDVGDNPTDYGVHKWTDRSVGEVLARYLARGNPLLVDIDHNVGKRLISGELPPEQPAVTAGYAKLELRDGAPWLLFEWSDEGERQIQTGERRFLSPEYDTDPETGEILHLYRVSLVGDPGTHHARVLASNPTGVTPMFDEQTLAAIRACIEAKDPAAALELLETISKGAAGGPEGEVAAAPPAAGAPKEEGPSSDKEPPMAAAAEPPKEEPHAAGTDDPPVVAAAPPPAKVAAGTPPPPVAPRLPAKVLVAPRVAAAAPPAGLDAASREAVTLATAAGSSATAAVDELRRDILLRDHGSVLSPTIRKWAESQPLAIVQGLLKATPGALAPPAIPVATRGGNGAPGAPVLHTAEAKERFKSAAELPMGPVIGGDGKLRIHACCPGEFRNQEATRHHAGK